MGGDGYRFTALQIANFSWHLKYGNQPFEARKGEHLASLAGGPREYGAAGRHETLSIRVNEQ